MLKKHYPMKQRLPALVVPDDMLAQLSKISEEEGLSLSETVRQGLAFFLLEYVSTTNNTESINNYLGNTTKRKEQAS